ncbi:MAG: 6-phosphofructokinase [Sulfurospirillum sp.]|nr:MAG: 6-phosphofructokinase [Sulfurospirillum sp.]
MALAIICSGGDAPGMNPAIKKFVDYVYKRGETPYFIYDGLEGMIDGKIKYAHHEDVAGILHNGGAIIGSSRSKRFYEKRYREQAYRNLQDHDIDGVVVLGGDGSYNAFEVLGREFPVNFVGIPTTIDNDIYGTEYCLGVDTALNVIRWAVDNIRDTASTFKRAFVVETMGRECGYLAAVTGLSSGAEICVIPEMNFNKNVAAHFLKKDLAEGRGYILAIVAEGTKMTQNIKEWLEEDIGVETRVTVLGHIQRGGNPTVHDRMMAFEFTVRAVDLLLANTGIRKAISYRNGEFVPMDISEVNNGKYTIPANILRDLHFLD